MNVNMTTSTSQEIAFAGEAICDAGKKSAAFAVLGVALKTFASEFSPPFFAISCSLFLTRLVVKIETRYHIPALRNLQREAGNLSRKYPKAQLITFIFALIITSVSLTTGLVMAVALGIFGGLTIGIEQNQQRLQRNRQEQEGLQKYSRMLFGYTMFWSILAFY